MSSLRDAVTYPTNDDDWTRTVLIGGLLTLFGFLLLPLVLVSGYLVRVIRHRLDRDHEPPGFDNWEALFGDGLRAFVIGFVYMLLPGLVAAVTIGGAMLAVLTGTESGFAAALAGLALGFMLTAVLTLAFGYVAVAGIVNFVREDRIGAAFDVSALRSIVFNVDYAIAWGLSVLVFVAAGVAVGVLDAIPVLGFIAGAFVMFYAQVVAANLWVNGYEAAREPDDTAGRLNQEEPAI